jgi:hypothetical protein
MQCVRLPAEVDDDEALLALAAAGGGRRVMMSRLSSGKGSSFVSRSLRPPWLSPSVTSEPSGRVSRQPATPVQTMGSISLFSTARFTTVFTESPGSSSTPSPIAPSSLTCTYRMAACTAEQSTDSEHGREATVSA